MHFYWGETFQPWIALWRSPAVAVLACRLLWGLLHKTYCHATQDKKLSSEAKNHLTNKTEREKKLNHYYYYHSERKWNLNHHYKRALIIIKKKTFPNLHFRKSVLIHFLLLWAWFFCYGNWSTRISYTIFKSPLNLSTWLEHLFE